MGATTMSFESLNKVRAGKKLAVGPFSVKVLCHYEYVRGFMGSTNS
jgi:hypothetical protein